MTAQVTALRSAPVAVSDPIATLPATPRSLRARWQHRYADWLLASDVSVLSGVVALAQIVRFGTVTSGSLWAGYGSVAYSGVSVLIVFAWAVGLAIYHTRAPQVIGAGPEEFRRVWTATLSVFGVLAVVSTLFKLDIARGYLAIAFPLGFVALSVNRRLARAYVSAQRRRGRFLTAVLAVGELRSVTALARSLTRHPADGYAVVGVCTPGGPQGGELVVPDLGRLRVFPYEDDIRHAIAASQADTVALTSAAVLGPDGIRDLSWQLEKLDVDLVVSPGIVDVAGPRLTVRPVADLPLIHVDKPQYQGAKRFQKRLFDVCFALLALLAAGPILIVAAVAVKVTSPGPVFYLSERTGLDGLPFRMIKFRTMVVDADRQLAQLVDLNDSVGGVLFKIRNDPRVTRVGRVLRRYSIDELPQFINVLRGEMSVVGPRPPLPREVATYDQRVRRRLLVRPGITGLWQISGRSDLSWEDSVRLDLSYVENWSMLSDLVIAVKTVSAIGRASGAY
ncbi:sugar transferase [Mycolicibacter terrae]|uniref:UDP-phosphate galactose phosphotransferase n=2 Tax=Mycolicibacter TaxID=1073531 RepID=A0A1A2XRZ2_MYCSD|nr:MULTISPECIES: sugar transferase [Mycolicibacter]OBH21172.1 UDP-phosphate galactose phosphotransferase [Mycolicibacter sinensis]OBI28504.1 UDP-phosphate galactose phosphotransferase [Mycolicibacter sinensis]RRR43008.1 sugar transferase [Mycolicibacter terrae]